MPDVSVVIPSFNRAELVCTAVQSVLDQPGCSVEAIVVDDGSTDGTKNVLFRAFPGIVHDEEDLLDGRTDSTLADGDLVRIHDTFPCVRYRRQSNKGMSPANNTGIRMCAGDFIKFLDSDDELLPDTLGREIAQARSLETDVLCTGFQERTYIQGVELSALRSHAPPPRLERGIDDMLTGQAPWTAAALYRSQFIRTLRWPPHIRFGNDWAWAWTVCLAGARFASLDIEAAIYKHHDTTQMTTAKDGFEKSVTARQQILQMVENSLREQGLLNQERRHALAQYFFKDALTLYERDPRLLKALCKRCEALSPGFRPLIYNPRVRPFISLLGPYHGVSLYVRVKRQVFSNPALKRSAGWILERLGWHYPVRG